MSPRRVLAPICRLLGHRYAESTPAPYVDRCQRCGTWVWGESMTAVLAMLAPHDGPCDECPHEAPDESTPPEAPRSILSRATYKWDPADGRFRRVGESTPPPTPEVSP